MYPKQNKFFDKSNKIFKTNIPKEPLFKIKACNIPKNIQMKEILELFGTCGSILKVDYKWNSKFLNSCEIFIHYSNEESVNKAMNELNGIKIDKNEIKILKLD